MQDFRKQKQSNHTVHTSIYLLNDNSLKESTCGGCFWNLTTEFSNAVFGYVDVKAGTYWSYNPSDEPMFLAANQLISQNKVQ